MVETAMRSMPIVSMEPPRPANSPTWRCAHTRRRRQSARLPQPEREVGIGDDAAQEMLQHQPIAAVAHGFRSSFRLGHGDLSGPGGVTIVPTGTALEERPGAKRSLQVV